MKSITPLDYFPATAHPLWFIPYLTHGLSLIVHSFNACLMVTRWLIFEQIQQYNYTKFAERIMTVFKVSTIFATLDYGQSLQSVSCCS